ncbi:unnamed protein product [Pleuronectes platessa]|uniref:Uncharacterized protein n=1 Tax=Pleuronectes platessa TaxID=8262 RepID=A0A9N7YX74_PLEPL|nr:unnamed protein product [Pleuronectes platessa]
MWHDCVNRIHSHPGVVHFSSRCVGNKPIRLQVTAGPPSSPPPLLRVGSRKRLMTVRPGGAVGLEHELVKRGGGGTRPGQRQPPDFRGELLTPAAASAPPM